MTPHVLLFAAGASRRMAPRDKLLEPVEGVPLLRRVALRALATGWPVHVLLPDRPARVAALSGLAVRCVTVARAAEGMGASFRAGMAAVGDGRPVMTVLADMPEIDTPDLLAVYAAFTRAGGDRPARAATADGRPGQPVIFPPRLLSRLAGLDGDTGGRAVLAGENVVAVTRPGERAIIDLDTPEDWAAWRARTGVVG